MCRSACGRVQSDSVVLCVVLVVCCVAGVSVVLAVRAAAQCESYCGAAGCHVQCLGGVFGPAAGRVLWCCGVPGCGVPALLCARVKFCASGLLHRAATKELSWGSWLGLRLISYADESRVLGLRCHRFLREHGGPHAMLASPPLIAGDSQSTSIIFSLIFSPAVICLYL